ncbi:hypothetical protein [Couchioplanes azureus]|uniref:hypothetical protein n=1 Tax=Couchioplanes caeruleus TaxID=56438 RepID=UPI00166FAAF8|nr:hypothetical protein [Couchioplanes caeruleus]GGQ57506.1 hypothetical protein GCM10010166_29100 [Couchioplanes caeruleus subsp. azureus]
MPYEAVPRSHPARVSLAALLDVAVIGGHVALRVAVDGATGNGLLAYLVSTAAAMGVTAWLAPKVSYRRRDALWWLTGVGGGWLFLTIAWRLAYLPHRDWPPRDDEIPQARYLRNLAYVGTWSRADGREPGVQPHP